MRTKRNAKHRRTARAGVCLTGAVLGTAALTVAYTDAMTSIVARRRSPLASRLSGLCTGKKREPEQAEQVRLAAEQLLKQPTEEVSLVNREGLTLKAHWYHAENPRRLLILVHGWHSVWNRDFGVSAPFYHENDCELLLIEQRSHGASEGKLIAYGARERYDVLEWLAYARTVCPTLPVYLCGLSMGAATVLLCAGEPVVADTVTAIVADCGYTVPEEVVSARMRTLLRGATDATMAAVNLNCRLRGGFTLKCCSTKEALAKDTCVPVFFIHGDADELVPCSMTLENYLACSAPKEILIVHGAGHATSFLVDPETYKARVLAFFAAWDGRLRAAKG